MSCKPKSPEDVLRTIKDHKIQIIDLRFTDLAGLRKYFSVPSSAFNFESFEGGVRCDAFSIHQAGDTQEDPVLMIPDPASAFIAPFTKTPTLALICNIRDSATGLNILCDPRYIAQKAEAYLLKTQVGDTANFGLRFVRLINGAQDDQSIKQGRSEVQMAEANSCVAARAGSGQSDIQQWSGDDFVLTPMDSLQDAPLQEVTTLQKIGVEVEARRQESETGRQSEIDMRFLTLTRMADNLMISRYVGEKVARQRGVTSAFMPKPLFDNRDLSMHIYQSIWQGEQPLFAGYGYAGSSALMRHYIAGLLLHAPALLAICESAPNSYHHLAPCFDAPISRDYSQRSRRGVFRVPYPLDSRGMRIEFRCPDPLCNPYITFAAMLMAGIDGFQKRLYDLDPSEPIENFHYLPPQAEIPSAPDRPEADYAFLSKGDVFPPDVINSLFYNAP